MDNNYGITHAAITAGAMIGTQLIFGSTGLSAFVGGATAGWWTYRETQGPGTLLGYPKDYKGVYTDWDRRLDWMLPIAVTAILLVVFETVDVIKDLSIL